MPRASGARQATLGLSARPSKTTREVRLLRKGIDDFFRQTKDDLNRRVCDCKFGVYAFYDYDGEPIYVGQTRESLRVRIRRHLTNQRTDAVAMSVLDPFEVLEIEVWPFFGLQEKWEKNRKDPSIQATLDAAEYAVYTMLLQKSRFGAVLNEKGIAPKPAIKLPKSYRKRIVPDELYEWRTDPDLRIARRAATIARLAQVVSEREVSQGLRRTLLTQARRLEWLARTRFEELGGEAKVEMRASGSEND